MIKKSKPQKKKLGRPTAYNKELGDRICEIVATTSMGLDKIFSCYEGLPHPDTVRMWRLKSEDFHRQYARAKVAQADILAEECLSISDDSIPANAMVDRLRIDTRKWLASKLLPKQYGEKLLLEQKTEENEQLKEELLALRNKLNEQYKKEF